MAGILEQFSKGLFGLAPTPAPNSVFGQALDSAAQWGRGVQDKAANIQTTLADLLRNPSNALPNIPPQTLANLLQQPVTPEQKQNIASKALDFGMEFGPLATVWHGSPHLFNKFDMSKIGTGEGAQAYGHGLYFAESPQVAANYKNPGGPRSGTIPITIDGVQAARLVSDGKIGGVEKRAADALARNRSTEHAIDYLKQDAEYDPIAKQAIDWITANKSKINDAPGASLYKVDIPDEHIAKMLDWDKPLSQQPQALKMLESDSTFGKNTSGWRGAPEGLWEKNLGMRTGEQIYRELTQTGMSQKEASDYMKSIGFKGIRYLDGGSRAGGQGTSNFVVFDDSIPKIIGRE